MKSKNKRKFNLINEKKNYHYLTFVEYIENLINLFTLPYEKKSIKKKKLKLIINLNLKKNKKFLIFLKHFLKEKKTCFNKKIQCSLK